MSSRSNSRIGRGWRLAKDSWRVLRSDRSLALFPVVGFIGSVVALVIILAPGVAIAAGIDTWWPIVPFAAVALYAATFVTIYAGVALAAASATVMDGGQVTVAEGLAAARARRGLIARWALVQATVGLILNLLQAALEGGNPAVRLIGTIIISLVGAAWSVATFFVVPLLAFEEVGPRDALKRSIGLVKERWGEGMVGSASIGGAIFLLGVLPCAAVIALGVLVGGPAGIVIAVIGALALVAVMVTGNALGQIFRVALYRFATTDRADGAFAAADLEAAFRPHRKGVRS
jgi:hypothetical protein